MKIVNNTDKEVVVRWKNPDPDNRANITLVKLFPRDDGRDSDVVLPENIVEDTVYIQYVEENSSE